MKRRSFLHAAAVGGAGALLRAQQSTPAPPPPAADRAKLWDGVYGAAEPIYNQYPNRFLAGVAEAAKPGRALDVGMGQGRNALYLASLGWEVTGVDISAKGIEIASANAKRRGLTIRPVQSDFAAFDLGKSQWDLISEMYMQGIVMGRAQQIAESLKPEGILVVEGFHRDGGLRSLYGPVLGFEGHQLLTAFAPHLRIVRYEEARDFGDWTRTGTKVPLVRMVAAKRSARP